MDAETVKHMGPRLDKARALIKELAELKDQVEDVTHSTTLEVTFYKASGTHYHEISPDVESRRHQLAEGIGIVLNGWITELEAELEAL